MNTSRTPTTATVTGSDDRSTVGRSWRRILRSTLVGLLATLCHPLAVVAAEPERIDFDGLPVGPELPGFSAALTGGGDPGRWVVEDDPATPGSKVLVQRSADPTSGRFPLIVYDGVSARDVAVSVRFKPIAGKVDQAAGIVWRYRDPSNYYVVRANALEGNVVLYKVEGGKRSDLKPVDAGLLAYGTKVPVPSGSWSTLGVEARGGRFAVSLDGKQLFDVEDSTFEDEGRIGLWTKADSVTAFDDLIVGQLEGTRP